MNADEHDPEATVWMAMAELERKLFTKREMVQALDSVAHDLLLEVE